MWDERLKDWLHVSVRALRPWEAAIAALLVTAVLLTGWGVGQETLWRAGDVRHSDQDVNQAQTLSFDDTEWALARYWMASAQDEIGWVRWDVPDHLISDAQPLAVELSGPFSAEIYFNTVVIGQKGVLPEPGTPERAGPIDSVTAIPSELIRSSGNLIAVRFASTRAGYTPAAVLQSLAITPYRPDARRSLRQYALTLGVAGVLIILTISAARLAIERQDQRLYLLMIGLAALVLAALAEMSRAYINYPYDWHQPRQALVLLGTSVFTLCLMGFCVWRWPGEGRWAGVLRRWGLAIAVLIAGAGTFGFAGYDGKIVWVTFVGLIFCAAWTLWQGFNAERWVWGVCAVLLVLIGFNLMAPGIFIDRGLYAVIAVAMADFLFRSADELSPLPLEVEPDLDPVLSVQSTGRLHRVPVTEVVLLKAAGNYTEVHRTSGDWLLDQRGLASLLDEEATGFLRIHRSYAVNLSQVQALVTRPGSRYAIALKTGGEAPVGRSRVQAVRDALQHA